MARVAAAAKEAHASGGGLLVANLGVHYSPQQREGDRRERKPKNEASAWDRSRLRQHLGVLLQLLDAFGSACPRCISVYVTTAHQHFPTPTGAWPSRAMRHESNCSWPAYGEMCTNSLPDRPPPSTPAAADDFRCRALPTPSPPLDANPNEWRNAEPRALLRNVSAAADGCWWCPGAAPREPTLRHVLFVPLHLATATLWDAHLGVARDGRQADCTHYCPAPFLWEPLWGAIGEAAFLG